LANNPTPQQLLLARLLAAYPPRSPGLAAGAPSDYDMPSYIAKYGQPDQSKGQHLTDEFKLPNHITFSTDSQYSTPERQGGVWSQQDGQWHYAPSAFVLQQHSPQELQEYFKRSEPNSVLDLPTIAPLRNQGGGNGGSFGSGS
jgi:hypothetical protein